LWSFLKRLVTSSQPRPPEQRHVRDPKFVGEQDGPTELILKQKLTETFAREPAVQRAYLARMSDGQNVTVVLALRAQPGFEQTLVQQIGSIFASIFNAKEHLDIVFVTNADELELKKVCRPFFGTSQE
jgi:hypothetical protein